MNRDFRNFFCENTIIPSSDRLGMLGVHVTVDDFFTIL